MTTINNQLKIEFVENVYSNTNTAQKYLDILQSGKRMELRFNKDISHFNLIEIEALLKSYSIRTEASIRQYISIIKSYINYCVEIKFVQYNILEKAISSQWIASLVLPTKPYLLDNEFEEIVKKCINPQDAVVLQLLFEGVCGNRFSELLNLKMEDVNVDGNILKLNDEGEIRYLVVSSQCIELIIKANNQKKYFVTNGNSEAKSTDFLLIESEYIIKKIKKGKHKKDVKQESKRFIISRRIESLSDIFGFPKEPKYIINSGKVALAKNIYLKDGFFNEKEALNQISFRFNLKTKNKNFTNPELISTLYNLNFDFKPFKLVDESLKDKENVIETVKRIRQEEFSDRIYLNYLEKCAVTNEL